MKPTNTTPCAAPMPPIPDYLRGADTGSFAHYTVTKRLPNILRQTLEDNRPPQAEKPLPPHALERLEALLGEIPFDPIRAIHDPGAPDQADWERYCSFYLGQDWLAPPWFFIEHYFYRRILEASGFFQPGSGRGVDPYAVQKSLVMNSIRDYLQTLGDGLQGWLAERSQDSQAQVEKLARLFRMNLWGNQADLSMFGVDDRPRHDDDQQQQAHLLVDDSREAARYLAGLPDRKRVDFIPDNAGLELVYDLVLADDLLESGMAAEVFFHLKAHPTFVSDAVIEDLQHTVHFLASHEHPGVSLLGRRLGDHLRAGRLLLTNHFFWNSPLNGWELPADLWKELGRSSLLISKGDANYRRLLGDRRWPPTTSFGDIVCYLPAPLVAVRVVKAELAAGLQPGQAERTARLDPDWLVDGMWGVIQFA